MTGFLLSGNIADMKNNLLREIPSVDELLKSLELKNASAVYSAPLVTAALRRAIDKARGEIISGRRKDVCASALIELTFEEVRSMLKPSIVKVINATGTILHTNIGRAVLSKDAISSIILTAEGNVNLEFDLEKNERGERDSHIDGLVKRLTSAQGSCVVNNNAAAVLITLNTLAEGKEVIISRGELIEIGGSFRLPEIIKKSGCILREVGTTNRTHPKDYIEAINENTALIFKAHTSNYNVVGFTSEVKLDELVAIGKAHNIPVVEDLGAGSLIDLSEYGLPKEPVVRERVETGADVITFSGDKLLGGPQSGLIVGKKEFIDKIKKNPLKRALRADKLTLSALEATLKLYLNKDTLPERLPTLKYMVRPIAEIEVVANKAKELLSIKLEGFEIVIEDSESVVGGGALPGHNIPTKVISITHKDLKPEDIMRLFLRNSPPILGRIKKEKFLLDMRTVENPSEVVPEFK